MLFTEKWSDIESMFLDTICFDGIEKVRYGNVHVRTYFIYCKINQLETTRNRDER